MTMNKQIFGVAQAMIAEYGYTNAHPGVPVAEWREAVRDGETLLGYWEWVANGFMEQ